MTVIPMQKISIAAHESSRAEIIEFLQKAGILEIRELGKEIKEKIKVEEAETDKDLEGSVKELKESIDFIESFSEEKKGIIEALSVEKKELNEKEAQEMVDKADCKTLSKNCRDLFDRLNNARAEREKLISDNHNLGFFKSLNIKLCDICGTKLAGFIAGSFTVRFYNDFINELKNAGPLIDVNVVNKTKTKVYVLIVFYKEQQGIVEESLNRNNFIRFNFPSTVNTPAEEIAVNQKKIDHFNNEELNIISNIKDLQEKIEYLKIAHDVLLKQIGQQNIVKNFGKTNTVLIIEGWIPKKEFRSFQSGLEKNVPATEVSKISPNKEEIPPVAISNPKVVGPFESVTKLYGLPSYSEIDPTLALSIFFIIFFALCLADAGYGIILAILSWLALKKIKMSEGGKKLIQLIFIGGIVTTFIGALTGGWFGIELEALPGFLGPIKSALLGIRLFDPMKNMFGMLIFSLILGVIHVLFGILISFYEKIRAGDYIAAVFDDLLWVYFIVSLIFYGVAKLVGPAAPYVDLAGKMSLAGTGLLIITQGRHQKNIIMKFLSGILSLYNVTSYLGNILSYSRLLALGLTTAGIAMAVNSISGMASGVPIFGFLFVILILVFGHTLNLVIGILGAFIHSARLQYVEFYQQFFKGGGKAYKPFTVETEYITLK